MSARGRIAGIALTVGLLGGAVAIGGGLPPPPAEIARSTSQAAENAREAVDNTESAVESTRALSRVAAAVRAQVDSSRRMLDIQLGIEESSRKGARESSGLRDELAAVTSSLRRLANGLRTLTALSSEAAASTETSVGAATSLDEAIAALKGRFDVVVKLSRRLDRKARGYRNLRRGTP